MSKINYKKTLSAKYALSLFEYAFLGADRSSGIDEASLLTISENIRFLQYLLSTNKEIQILIENPAYPVDLKLNLLVSFIPNINAITKAFLQILGERNHLSYLLSIIEEYNLLFNNLNNIQTIKIISRVPVESADKINLQNAIETYLNNKIANDTKLVNSSKPAKLVFDYLIDDNILGGLVIVQGFTKIDMSVKYKIQEFLKIL